MGRASSILCQASASRLAPLGLCDDRSYGARLASLWRNCDPLSPGYFTSLLTVMGCTIMFRAPFLQASARHVTIVAALFGAALIAKPSISPVTLVIYCASLLISVTTDGN